MVKSRFLNLLAVTALLATIAIAGCHSHSVEGTYSDATGRISLELKGGKAYLNLGGAADPNGTPYDVNGDKISIHYPSDGMLAAYSTMTLDSDGNLQSGFGTLKKK
jgi:hypothetical protein